MPAPRAQRTVPTGGIFALITLLAVAASPILAATGVLGSCPFLARFAIPCLTCFSTRAFAALARGDIVSALSIQPLITSTALIMIAWGIADFLRWRAGRGAPLAGFVARHRAIVSVFLPCAMAANWLYLVYR